MGIVEDIVKKVEETVSNVGKAAGDSLNTFGDIAQLNLQGAVKDVSQFASHVGEAVGFTHSTDTPSMTQAGPAPNRGSVTQEALQAQLQQEVRMRGSQGFFPGGGSSGLIDQPQTASRVLLSS